MSNPAIPTSATLDASTGQVRTADILERLARLRTVLPAMGQELASARREAAKLRVENGRLRDRLCGLEAKLAPGADGVSARRTAGSRRPKTSPRGYATDSSTNGS